MIAWRFVGVLLLSVVAVGCGSDDGTKTPDGPFKAAWVYVGPPGDVGWTFAHDQGRLAVETEIGEDIETTFRENIPEADSEAVIEELVTAGNDMIFTTSFGYGDPTLAVAQRHPEATFEHCSGFKTNENMAVYFGRMYQARFLTGMVAGRMTTTNKIGAVAAHPIPEVIRHLDAIILGARSVNPDAELHVRWAHAWYDPSGVEVLANELLDADVDVVMQDTDDNGTIFAARDRGKFAIGYNSDVLSFAQDTVLTSAVWNWGTYYGRRVREAMDGSWTTGSYWGSIGDGIVGLGAWGDSVPMDVRDEVEAMKVRFENGELDVFDGEIRAQDGSVLVPAGETMSDADMLGLSVLVEGMVGEIPERCDICG